ncbi:dihydroorotase [Alkalicella caledoniensis]|uniref:Dihydroorotase n=1 Tax=Alkalicella caledoniensis TaxID=2731377 RepID=A0A7G9WC56_ALKCA|nr:dihydroorotase [Alkalicella caledoniensis]QNO16268.1 dihydroorotase [Alkalicella caledoniensis]
MRKKILLKGGSIYSNGKLILRDVLIDGETIKEVAQTLIDSKAEVLDLRGKIISPGFLDMHCHIRTPGQEYKEDIVSATNAAIKGGYTAIVAMANTSPVIDNLKEVNNLQGRIKSQAVCHVHILGAVTKGLKGEELVDYTKMQEYVVAFSDDGVGIQSEGIMEKALKQLKEVDKLIISHCEYDMPEKGVINQGEFSKALGVNGIDNSSEWAMVKRDLQLAQMHDARIHIAHVSTKESVKIIQEAKENGLKVTAEACPHHFLLTDSEVEKLQAIAKVNPPLRSEEDRLAVLKGLKEGVIDCIATDHAPHSEKEKGLSLYESPFGMVGLETAVSLCLDLVKKEILSIERVIEALGVLPYKILRLEGGAIEVGKKANLTVVDLNEEFCIDKEAFLSKGKNTPFNGYRGKGVVSMTIVNGVIKYKKGGIKSCL